MVMSDSPHFVVVYLAAMRVGAIPVPVSTMLRADGIAELLRDSRARFLAVTSEFAAVAESAAAAAPAAAPELAAQCLAEFTRSAASPRPRSTCSTTWRARRPTTPSTTRAPTRPPSGSTPRAPPGTPKGAMHRHGSVQVVCETYGAAGARHPPGRPLPVGGEGVLRLRPRQLGAVPAVGRRGERAAAGAVAARPDRRDRRQVRRDAVLRRPDVLRQHAPRPACRRTRWPGSGWPPRRARRCPPRCTRGGRRTSASTSSTASG